MVASPLGGFSQVEVVDLAVGLEDQPAELAQRLRHARMIFTRRALGRSLGAKMTAATSSTIGKATSAAVMAVLSVTGYDADGLTPSVGQHEPADPRERIGRSGVRGKKPSLMLLGMTEAPGLCPRGLILGVQDTHMCIKAGLGTGEKPTRQARGCLSCGQHVPDGAE
ncbi:hypothetical protein [uncultured Jatrophihabitans sp.]|uniref:hypothetical protein n=1 Tax=uncultured Jatrophihabitans sp. TaxID=1610747 RepID=UPI0035CB6671